MLLTVCGAQGGPVYLFTVIVFLHSCLLDWGHIIIIIHIIFFIDVCKACHTGAITGGVVAVVIVSIITALTVIVVVALLKKHFGTYSSGAQNTYVTIMWNKLVNLW